MRKSIERMELVHDFLKRAFSGSLHAKRILSVANGTLGVLTGASLAVSVIGTRWRKRAVFWTDTRSNRSIAC